jgi:NTP pyrophosphatase (non-canonical NTP hydrolase)
MSKSDDSLQWESLANIDQWLDTKVSMEYKSQPLAQDWARIGKVIEELGEAIRAMVGYTGQNPRKGVTHSQQEMLDELADTAITAILAMLHFTKNAAEAKDLIQSKVRAIEWRMTP